MTTAIAVVAPVLSPLLELLELDPLPGSAAADEDDAATLVCVLTEVLVKVVPDPVMV